MTNSGSGNILEFNNTHIIFKFLRAKLIYSMTEFALVKGKGICLECRYPCDYMFFRLYLPWQSEHSNLQLLIQHGICAPGTRYSWVHRGGVEYKVYPTRLHVASTGNRTPGLLILSPTPYCALRDTSDCHICDLINKLYNRNTDKPLADGLTMGEREQERKENIRKKVQQWLDDYTYLSNHDNQDNSV